jgi:hypothetical protein
LGRCRWRRHPGRASRRGIGTPAAAANHHRRASAAPADDPMVRAARKVLRASRRHLPGTMAAAAMNLPRKPLAALAGSAIIAATLLIPNLAHARRKRRWARPRVKLLHLLRPRQPRADRPQPGGEAGPTSRGTCNGRPSPKARPRTRRSEHQTGARNPWRT